MRLNRTNLLRSRGVRGSRYRQGQPYSPAAMRSAKIWSPTMAIWLFFTPRRCRATIRPMVSGLQARGTQSRPIRSAKGRTRLAVLLDTMVRLMPAARISSSQACTVGSSTWLLSPVSVLSTSSTSAVMPCAFR